MPGITGIINKNSQEINDQNLELMINCMMHEPFYVSAKYINHELGFYFGVVSSQGTFSDCMPVENEKKNLILFFTGENFVDREVLDKLKSNGHEFDDTNASYIIHMYEEKGAEFLTELNGFYSGVLIDLNLKKAILFNDRFGMQRMFVHENSDHFLFSSEAKSLLKIRPELRELDYKSLGEFFSCGCVLENRTLFSNVSLLPGGAAWTFEKGKDIHKRSFFLPETWENQEVMGKDEFYENLKEVFPRILSRYFTTNRRIALSATGGLDTRLILACRENPPGTLPCYTHTGLYRESFDVKVARKIAKASQQSHDLIHVGEEFLEDFPALTEKSVYISDGNLSAIQSVGLYTNKLAREFTDVRMTGNYGSEVLRNAVMFKPSTPSSAPFNPDFFEQIKQTRDTYRKNKQIHPVSFIAFRQAPWHLYNRYVVENSQVTQRSPYMDNDLLSLVFRAPSEVLNSNETSLKLIEEFDPLLRSIPTDRGLGGNSNAVFTLFGRIYYELTFKMDYYFNHGMPQGLAKFNKTFSALNLEKVFLGRHKYNHFRVWFRDQLSEYIKDVLLDDRTLSRPYLNGASIKKMVQEHVAGNQNFTSPINTILTIELLERLLIEQS